MNSEGTETTQSHTSFDSSYSKILQEGNSLMRKENTLMNIEIERDNYIPKDKIINIKSNQIKQNIRRGNVFTFWPDKNGDPRIVIGPHCNIYT
jgi:hypothetical protein